MQPVGRVRIKVLQRRHLANFRRDSNERAPVEIESLDRLKLADGSRKFDDRPPLFPSKFLCGIELHASIVCSAVNEFEKTSPRFTICILPLGMQLEREPLSALILRFEAITKWLIIHAILV